MRELRPFQASGHQCYFKGYFHCWGGTSERAYAIVEDEHGRVHFLEGMGNYKFLDRSPKEENPTNQ